MAIPVYKPSELRKNQVQWGYEVIEKEEEKARLEAGWANPTPKIQEAPPSPPLNVFQLDEVPARRLRKDVMQVYNELGGAAYLAKLAGSDPDLFNRLLLKIIPQAVEADVKMEATVKHDVKAITTAQLKALVMERLVNERSAEIDVTPNGPDDISQ